MTKTKVSDRISNVAKVTDMAIAVAIEGPYELPLGWKWNRLGDVCFTTSGGTPKRGESEYYNGTIPWVKSGELDRGLITDSEEKITAAAVKNSSAKIFPKGTLLIALYGATIGKLAFLGVDAATNQAICGIYSNEKIHSQFLYYLLFYNKEFLVKQGIGGAQPNISQTILKNLLLPIPPMQVQEAIVSKIEELFSVLDKGIESLKLVQQQLKVYRQSVLKWAFEGRLTEEWRKLNKGAVGGHDPLAISMGDKSEIANLRKVINENDHTSEFKDIPSLIQEKKEFEYFPLPEVWKWVQLGRIVSSVEYGSAIKSKDNGLIPVLRMGNIQNGSFDWCDLKFTDDKREIERYILKKDDVLFNRTNSAEWVGKTARYNGNRPAIFAGYLIRINRIESLIDANYLTYFLNSHFARAYGNTVRSFGVNQSNINGTKLKTYPIPLTSFKEQQQIVMEIECKYSQCDRLESEIRKNIISSETLRQSILKQAFEGKLLGKVTQQETVIKPDHKLKIAEGISNTDLHAGILTMVTKAHEKNPKHLSKLTHIKGEKISHLVEYHLGLSLGRVPVKDAAGPDDYPHLKKVEHRANKMGAFATTKIPGGYTYKSLQGGKKLVTKVEQVLSGDDLVRVKGLIETFLPFEEEHAEVIATLYAGWNNLLIMGNNPTDEEIVWESRENWSERKLSIDRRKFFKALEWMRRNGYIPAGVGLFISNGKKNTTESI